MPVSLGLFFFSSKIPASDSTDGTDWLNCLLTNLHWIGVWLDQTDINSFLSLQWKNNCWNSIFHDSSESMSNFNYLWLTHLLLFKRLIHNANCHVSSILLLSSSDDLFDSFKIQCQIKVIFFNICMSFKVYELVIILSNFSKWLLKITKLHNIQ